MPFTVAQGARLYWKLEGDNNSPPLVLLNSIGTDIDLWDATLPVLRRRFRLVRIDTRGHGASSATTGDYSLTLLANDVLAILSDASIASAAVAGVSLGGMMAMELALLAPEKITQIALVCTSAAMDRMAWTNRVERVRAQGMAKIADLAMERLLSSAFVGEHPEIAATVYRQLLSMDANGYAGCGAAIRDMQLIERLKSIKHPALVVTGQRDISTPLGGHGDTLLKCLSDARHVEIDAAHLAPIEAPDELSRALETFFC